MRKLIYLNLLAFMLTSSVWADSTNVFRVKSSNQPVPKAQVYAPEIEIKTAPVQNNDFQNLPNCMELRQGEYVERAFNCPDINGKVGTVKVTQVVVYYEGNVRKERTVVGDSTLKNCPDVCVLNRTPESDWDIVHNPTLTIKNPQCPPGYIQTASFNMQREFKYQNGKSFLPANDEELADYKARTGFSCRIYPGTDLIKKITSSCEDVRKNDLQYNAGYEFTDTLNNRSYKFRLKQWTQTCYHEKLCWGGVIKRVVWTENPPSTAVPSCTQGSSIIDYLFAPIMCYGPPGNYSTGVLIPTSIVCSRVQPIWRKS